MLQQSIAITKSRVGSRRVPIIARLAEAKEVIVTGDFTGWSEDGIRLAQGLEGEWRTTLKLPPGEYQYRLRVDGNWQDHAEAEKRISNPFGSANCLLTVL